MDFRNDYGRIKKSKYISVIRAVVHPHDVQIHGSVEYKLLTRRTKIAGVVKLFYFLKVSGIIEKIILGIFNPVICGLLTIYYYSLLEYCLSEYS